MDTQTLKQKASKTNFQFRRGDYFRRSELSEFQYQMVGLAMLNAGFDQYEFQIGVNRYSNFYFFGINIDGELFHADDTNHYDTRQGRRLSFEDVFPEGSLTEPEVKSGPVPVSDAFMAFFMETSVGQTIYHFRNTDKDGTVLSHGGGTAVVVRLPQSGKILLGVSACSKEDNFDRKEGVRMAKLRLKDTGQVLEKVPAKHELRSFIGRFCDEDTKRIAKAFKGGVK